MEEGNALGILVSAGFVDDVFTNPPKVKFGDDDVP